MANNNLIPFNLEDALKGDTGSSIEKRYNLMHGDTTLLPL